MTAAGVPLYRRVPYLSYFKSLILFSLITLYTCVQNLESVYVSQVGDYKAYCHSEFDAMQPGMNLSTCLGTFLPGYTALCSRKMLSSSLVRQPLVGPDLLKKLCPFFSVVGDFLPILTPSIGPVLTSSDFVTIFFLVGVGLQPHAQPPAILEDRHFSVGVVSLS